MSDRYLPRKIIVTASETDFDFSRAIARFARQRADIRAILSPDKFSGGEFNPFHKRVKKEYEKGSRFDPKKVYNGKTIFIIKTAGAFQDPEKMVARVGKIAYSFKHEYGADKVVVIATDLDNGRADRSPSQDQRMIGYMNTVRWMAEVWKASGVDQVRAMHVHSPDVVKTFQEVMGREGLEALVDINPVFIHADYFLRRSETIKPWLKNDGEGIVYLALDKGAYEFMQKFSDAMGLKGAQILRFNKARAVPNDPDKLEMEAVGEYPQDMLSGKLVLGIDDILDSGGTIAKAYRWIEENYAHHNLGTPAEYVLGFTHAVLSGKGFLATQEAICNRMRKLREIVVCNTRPYIGDNILNQKFERIATILRTAETFADVIAKDLDSSAKIEKRHKALFEEDILIGRVYSIARSEYGPQESEDEGDSGLNFVE